MELDPDKVIYYKDMFLRHRCNMYYLEDKLIGLITFFVGDDDKKFLYDKTPWSIIDDDPLGKTVYVDQLITVGGTQNLYREFKHIIKQWKSTFPNVNTVKWVRMGADFRKHNKKEGASYGVFIKSI